ncbi:hypothetical protein D9756_010411 [Leucocoprinus leucothites]|uniref:Uncharacterized protein n=1 Tax=Leucocoprinus leucothites TaxID=201217 RepID=A0A8H5CSV8_9AGAR|nr:hypothetical protein D9756_010411 [Leucoagaricus leucothites]
MPFPITAAQLAGNFCQTLLYGAYLVTCAFCARTLLIKGSGRDERWVRLHEVRWMMAIMAVIFLLISTFDVAIGLLHNYEAFIQSNDPVKVLTNTSDWIDITRSTDQGILMVLADFILIYRCWIVHGRRWLVILPSLVLYLGGTTSIAGLLVIMGEQTTADGTLTSDKTTPWFLAFYAITAVQNGLTTGILIWRIWRVEKESERYYSSGTGTISYSGQPRRLSQVIRVIGESGAAYTVCVLVTFILAALQSNALYPASDITLQITGISFNVILIRSSARRDHQFTMFDQNDRSTVLSTEHQTSAVSKPSIRHVERSRVQDIELGGIGRTLSDRDIDIGSSQEDFGETGGIKITKTVEKG